MLPSSKQWSRGESNPRAGSSKHCKYSDSGRGGSAGGAESGAFESDSSDSDRDLARLIDGWPGLPEAIRRAIMALVETTEQHSDLAMGLRPTPRIKE